jgi:pepF/M3 family oligoendopeptidase
MSLFWDLSALYDSFEGKYQDDLQALRSAVANYNKTVSQKVVDEVSYLESVLKAHEVSEILIGKLYNYASLIQATDVNNAKASKSISDVFSIYNNIVIGLVKIKKHLLKVDISKVCSESSFLKKYEFLLTTLKEGALHSMSPKEEILYAGLNQLSSSWVDLQSLATANLLVNYKDKQITLSQVRNLAYEADPVVRKEAYEAELEAYKSVENFVALALSNIKREVNLITKKRHYNNPIDHSLNVCHMSKASLDALLGAINDSKEMFARYLKAKAKYLGYEGSLPFYELFAPVGKASKTYTYEEAKELVCEAYNSFSPKLGQFGLNAFNNSWIDVEPKPGKVGGAFCSNIPSLGISRVLTNFTGSLSDCLTLAHELGHAYHGDVIASNAPLNWDYPMQLAETASIFCETITNNHLLSKITSKEERLWVLESQVQDATQVIIDILSRYLFERSVLDLGNSPIDAAGLKELMLNAQKEAYLDGLDHNQLHPYMWLCKGHYYSLGFNYYNFPYAFGLLYGKGLYSIYLKDKKPFIDKYDKMLYATTHKSAEDVALEMGIDITSKAFWAESLQQIKQDIEEVISLMEDK